MSGKRTSISTERRLQRAGQLLAEARDLIEKVAEDPDHGDGSPAAAALDYLEDAINMLAPDEFPLAADRPRLSVVR